MKTKIKEVHNYLRNKLVKGEFQITKFETHTVTLLVDDLYIFRIWTGNQAYSIECYYAYEKPCFIHITFRKSDKKALWNKLKNQIQNWKDTTLKREKTNRFLRLKEELKL